jgi:hypothetical protein
VVPHVAPQRPELGGQEHGLSVECGKTRVPGEPWGNLDGPAVWIDREEPSVEQSMQVASQEQSASRVVLRRCAVEVKMRGFERSGWLRTGEGAGFAEAGEHGFPEPLLAKPGLAKSQRVAAGNSLILPGIRAPPGGAGDQMGVQNRPELGHVQAADRVLLRSGDVGRMESALGKGLVRWPPRPGVVGGEYLDSELFLSWYVELRRAAGAPVAELPSRPVLEIRAGAVRAPVSDLAARRCLDAVDPSSAEDDAVVTDHREVPRGDVAAIRDGRVPDVANAQLVWVRRCAVRRGGQAQQAPGAECRHVRGSHPAETEVPRAD